MVREGVILAAGQGTRIRGISGDIPKPLVPVNNTLLIDLGIENLLRAGVEHVVVVVGYLEDIIRAHVAKTTFSDRVTFVNNEDWQKENGLSVYAARQALKEDWFFIQMVDHVFDPGIYDRAMSYEREEGVSYLCIDRNIDAVFDIDDATKLRVGQGGAIDAIHKQLDDYNAVDTGLFVMHRSIFDFFERAIQEGRNTISNAVDDAGKAGRFHTLDVTGMAWLDVDTTEAWYEAQRRLAAANK